MWQLLPQPPAHVGAVGSAAAASQQLYPGLYPPGSSSAVLPTLPAAAFEGLSSAQWQRQLFQHQQHHQHQEQATATSAATAFATQQQQGYMFAAAGPFPQYMTQQQQQQPQAPPPPLQQPDMTSAAAATISKPPEVSSYARI